MSTPPYPRMDSTWTQPISFELHRNLINFFSIFWSFVSWKSTKFGLRSLRDFLTTIFLKSPKPLVFHEIIFMISSSCFILNARPNCQKFLDLPHAFISNEDLPVANLCQLRVLFIIPLDWWGYLISPSKLCFLYKKRKKDYKNQICFFYWCWIQLTYHLLLYVLSASLSYRVEGDANQLWSWRVKYRT